MEQGSDAAEPRAHLEHNMELSEVAGGGGRTGVRHRTSAMVAGARAAGRGSEEEELEGELSDGPSHRTELQGSKGRPKVHWRWPILTMRWPAEQGKTSWASQSWCFLGRFRRLEDGVKRGEVAGHDVEGWRGRWPRGCTAVAKVVLGCSRAGKAEEGERDRGKERRRKGRERSGG